MSFSKPKIQYESKQDETIMKLWYFDFISKSSSVWWWFLSDDDFSLMMISVWWWFQSDDDFCLMMISVWWWLIKSKYYSFIIVSSCFDPGWHYSSDYVSSYIFSSCRLVLLFGLSPCYARSAVVRVSHQRSEDWSIYPCQGLRYLSRFFKAWAAPEINIM